MTNFLDGEKYSQALEKTEYEYGTLRNFKYVASQVDLSCRHDNVSFTHHQEVASLPPPEQKKWLERAEGKGCTVKLGRKTLFLNTGKGITGLETSRKTPKLHHKCIISTYG